MMSMQLGEEVIELRIIPRKKGPQDALPPGRALPADGGRSAEEEKPSVDGP